MIRWVFSTVLLCLVQTHALAGPVPPCGTETVPPYPALGAVPAVKFWSEAELGRDWQPPACTGWTEVGFSSLTTIAARFPYTGGSAALLLRIGAISELAGMRYWSTSHQQWRTLVVSAHALNGPPQSQRREDFVAGEMQPGKSLYLEQVDNLSGKAIFRMLVISASPDRIVFDVANVTTMRYLLMPLFHPGEMQSICFLDRESDGAWRYYSIVRTGRNASGLTAGHEASSINRAVAFYRSLAGIRTNQEPPAAR